MRKFTMGPIRNFFLSCRPKLRHVQRKIRKIVTDIYGAGASLMGSSGLLIFSARSIYAHGDRDAAAGCERRRHEPRARAQL